MYIVMEIQTNTNGEVATLINQFENINNAESKFHQILASASVSEIPVHTAVLMDEKGVTYRAEYYDHGVNASPSM